MKKIKVLFVCKGNICRSTMAQFVFSDMAKKNGINENFLIDSAATTDEQKGKGIAPGTIDKLKENSIPYEEHIARKMTTNDYSNFDYIVGMEQSIVDGIMEIIGEDSDKKVYNLHDFSEEKLDIVDPVYTNDFDRTYREIETGCKSFMKYLESNVLKK